MELPWPTNGSLAACPVCGFIRTGPAEECHAQDNDKDNCHNDARASTSHFNFAVRFGGATWWFCMIQLLCLTRHSGRLPSEVQRGDSTKSEKVLLFTGATRRGHGQPEPEGRG